MPGAAEHHPCSNTRCSQVGGAGGLGGDGGKGGGGGGGEGGTQGYAAIGTSHTYGMVLLHQDVPQLQAEGGWIVKARAAQTTARLQASSACPAWCSSASVPTSATHPYFLSLQLELVV
jgi:hypothetical protein